MKSLTERVNEALNNDRPLTAIVLLRQLQASSLLSSYQTYLLADSLRIIGRQREALELFAQLRRSDMPEAKAWLVVLRMGQVFLEQGELSKAEAAFREAAELKPSSTVPWVFLGTTVSRMERFDEACEVFKRGLQADGDIDEVYLNLGYTLRTLNRFEEAREALKAALRVDSECLEASYALADLDNAIAELKIEEEKG